MGKPKAEFAFQAFNPDDFDQLAEQAAIPSNTL